MPVVWCVLSLCLWVASAHAQTSRLDSMQYLQNVTVYGVKPYAEVIPAQTLSGAKLEALSSHSVADAIRYFAGVQIKDYGGVGGLKTVDVRSMGSNHMGVFYDGIQLGNAQNGQVDLGRFSLDNIDEVALYNGQKSEIFQSARDFGTSGSIYLRTRRPQFAKGQTDHLLVTMRTGSFGLVNPSVRWEHKFSPHVSLSLNTEGTLASGKYHFRYRKFFSDGELAWDTTAVRRNGDVQALRAEASLFGTYDGSRWMGKLYYYVSERGIPGAIVNNVWKTAQRQWDRNFFAQGSYERKCSERYELRAQAKYARDYLRYLNPDTTLMLIDNKFWQDEIYLSTAHKVTLARDWDVNLAVDYQWNYLNSTQVNFVYPTRHSLLTALATAYTWRGFKAQASLLHTHIADRYTTRNDGTVLAHHRKRLDRFTPAVFVSYRPWAAHDLSFRAYYKTAFRMPTFNDLYYTDMGNVQLRPERAMQVNVGAQYQLFTERGFVASARLTADAYYNRITDKIVAIPTGSGQYRWMMMNIGEVRIRGIDLTAAVALRLPADIIAEFTLSYTHQHAQDYSDPTDRGEAGSYHGQIAYVPWHNGSVATHLKWRDLDVNHSFIYVGERYHNSSNIPANYEQPWYTHDLSASYRFALRGTRYIKVTAEANNLFNQQYEVILNYPMPGRNYRVGVAFGF
ncbi:MAG: TonB-dependent receptor [Muribaculaceae bacterium]|nr:TonB-dependent receptor [Muribaculaceae bacterium]